MEDQGIMALPQAGMQAPTTAPEGSPQSEAAIAAFDQARMQMDPKEFGDELLSAAEQADPAAVQEFRQALAQMNLPPEVIDALGQMVDAILAEPQNYAQIRADFIAEGVPEDILPPEFDAMYFAALNMALDQLSGAAMPMNVQAFANGGIATLTPVAQMLAAQGRNGDTMLAHITPAEARMLRRQGGSGTINPVTGLPEFFVKKIAKAVGNTVKSVGKAVSSAVKSVTSAVKKFTQSSVGKMVTAVALGFFLGPAAASLMGVTSAAGVAAVSGFIGSAGSSLLAGGNLKDSFKAGAVGALTAGAMAGATQGMNAFQAGSYTGPTTISGQVDRATQSLQSLTGTGPQPTIGEVSGSTLDYTGTGDVTQGVKPAIQPPTVQAPPTALPEPLSYQPQFGAPMDTFASAPATTATDTFSELIRPVSTPPAGTFDATGTISAQYPPAAAVPTAAPAIPTAETGAFDMGQFTPQEVGLRQAPSGFMGTLERGYNEYVRPFTPTGMRESGQLAAEQAYRDTLARTGSEAIATKAYEKALPGMFGTYGPMVATGMGAAYLGGAFDPREEPPPGIVPRTTGFDLYNQSPEVYGVTPGGMTATYPGVSAGYGQMPISPYSSPQFNVRNPQQYMRPRSYAPMGLMSLRPQGFALGGAVKGSGVAQPVPGGATVSPGSGLMARAIQEALRAGVIRPVDEQAQQVQAAANTVVPGGSTASVTPPLADYGVISRFINAPSFLVQQPSQYVRKGIAAMAPRRYNTGGYATGGGIRTLAQRYPRRNGAISGPGTETSDDIPAMLSDGEFVMTAKAVRGAGGGSRREGAKRMYEMMRKFERKA